MTMSKSADRMYIDVKVLLAEYQCLCVLDYS